MGQLGLQLDSMYGNFLAKSHECILIELGDCLTLASKNEDAFALKNPDNKITRPVVENVSTGDQAIVRAIVPYSLCSQMAQDYLTGIYVLSLYKNAMMKKIAENFNVDTAKVKPTFALPGRNSAYFRESESMAGLELRIYASN